MKKTYNILRRIAIIVAALSVSSAAWSTDYYLWLGTQSNPTWSQQPWSSQGKWNSTLSDESNHNYVWDLDYSYIGNYFIIISKSNSSSSFYNSSNNKVNASTRLDKGDVFNNSQIQDFSGYYYLQIGSGQTEANKVRVRYNSSENKFYLTDVTTYCTVTPSLTGSTDGVSVTSNKANNRVASGGSIVFTLSGMSGKHIASASLSPVAAGGVTTAGTVTVSNVTADATLTINIAGDAVAATAYMGEKPYRDANGDIHAKVFLAQTGGSTVTAIRLYYKNGSEPSDSDDYVDLTAPFSCNNQYNALISGASLEDGTYYLKAKVTNDGGSSYTDVVTIVYVTCEGRIDSFELTPTEGSVIKGQEYTFVTSTDGGGIPSYKWYVNDVEQGGEIESSFTYKIPANYAEDDIDIKVQVTGGNCHDEHTATATMDICATPTISLSGSSTSTPWAPVNITATTTNTETVNWSVTAGGTMYNTSNSGAIFKGASSATAYTVTAEASSGVCGKAQATHTITVSEASEEVCP